MNQDAPGYIIVEGPIGVGKTSLARRLAATFGSVLLLERAEDNPFLERFYQHPRQAALPTQLSFLLQRVQQLEHLRQGDMFRGRLISDFLLQKDRLFAQLSLDDDELQLYEQVYQHLSVVAPQPDLVIYLQAPVGVLLERVKKRGISYERLMESAYLLRMAVQAHDTTAPVTMDQMVHHCAAVARGRRRALLMADMPFMSYATTEQALCNAARLMQEGGAHMVKLEGGAIQVETVRQLSARGIPVCAHLGLQPQSVHRLGGYRVLGRDCAAAYVMLQDARALQDAGADVLLVESVPTVLAAEITRSVSVPVVGIGAGPACDGQVLVLYDMLGITPGHRPKFARDFMRGQSSVRAAAKDYVQAVKSGAFPAPEHCFN